MEMQSSLFSILSNAMRVCVYDSRQFSIVEPKQVEKPTRDLLARCIFRKLTYIKLTQQANGLSIKEMKVKAMD